MEADLELDDAAEMALPFFLEEGENGEKNQLVLLDLLPENT